MIAFLDSCIVIYWVEMAMPFHARFIQKLEKLRSDYGDFSFAVSYLSLLECRIKPLREQDIKLIQKYQKFFTAHNLKLVPLTLPVINSATQLRVDYKLTTPDALQAASALSLDDEVLFISNDAIFKRVPELKNIIF